MEVTQEHPQKQEPQMSQLKARNQEAPGKESVMTPKPDHGETSYRGFGRLKDKVAVITGGDSGIGKAVCLAYAREGANIVCSYLNEHQDAEGTKRLVEESGRKCVLIPGDISEDEQCKTIIDEAVKVFGHIDILVNNAGYQRPAIKDVTELDYKTVLHTFKVNIISMFSLIRYAVPHMREGGSIINCASIQAYQPNPGILDYATTKAAIVALTKGLAKSLIDKGIRSNAVAPGPVWTPLIQVSWNKAKQEKFGDDTPMKRPAHPIEMAGPFVFLASSESTFVNGEILAATGGMITA